MKNIVENQGIKTDKPLPMSYEALKAERDALADKCDRLEYNLGNAIVGEQEALQRVNGLAVENAALKSKGGKLVHEASEVYSAYNATIKEPDGDFMDMQTLYEMQCIETPATDAALAAIRDSVLDRVIAKLGAMGSPDFTLMAIQALKNELREAK